MATTKRSRDDVQVARQLQIGDRLGRQRKDGSFPVIKSLHELCPKNRNPHVHAITSEQSFCLAFHAGVRS